MGQNLKVVYNTPSATNSALKDAITYVGKRRGKLANRNGYENKDYLKYGVKYIAKKFGNFNISKIKRMYLAEKIENSPNKRWIFNKRIYADAYKQIVDVLLDKECKEDTVYICELLQRLYAETQIVDPKVSKYCSNALIYYQKEMLNLSAIDKNLENAVSASKILKQIEDTDERIP
jgi:hypothetical protein